MSGIHFSPLTAIPVGPAGPPSKLTVSPYSGTAIVVASTGLVQETDSQWVLLGLTVPDGVTVMGFVVCYQILGGESTYISQVRLSEMTKPNKAIVRYDDPNNNSS